MHSLQRSRLPGPEPESTRDTSVRSGVSHAQAATHVQQRLALKAMHPSRTRSSRGTNSLRAGKIPPPMTQMPRDQRSPRPPITRKNPVGHLWFSASFVLGKRSQSGLCSPRRRASRRSGAQPIGAASAASPHSPKNSPPTGHITPPPVITRQLHNFLISAMLGCSALRLLLPARHPITISNHRTFTTEQFRHAPPSEREPNNRD